MLATFKGLLLAGIVPRLCLTGLSYAQVFLVSRVVNFMEQPETTTSNKVAYGLIAAYAIVYIGIAVYQTIHDNPWQLLIRNRSCRQCLSTRIIVPLSQSEVVLYL
jgi:hypothetical protein